MCPSFPNKGKNKKKLLTLISVAPINFFFYMP